MADDVEWIVPMAPVRDADRRARAIGPAVAAPRRPARVAELRRRVLGGHYASEAMMDAVARRLLERGEL